MRWVLVLGAAAVGISLAGCPAADSGSSAVLPPAKIAPQPLVVVVADDPALGRSIAFEWRSRTEEDLTVRDVTSADLVAAHRLPGDAVIFPVGLIGQLAERGLILPLEPAALEDPDFNHRDIFDQIRLRETKWGTRTFAAPLGSPQLLLVYRGDVLAHLGVAPPADWGEYQRLIVQLADRQELGALASPERRWRASAEPLAEGWAGQMLLARAAAYALHRDQVSALFRFDTMAPLIDQPPFVRALEELVAAAKAGGFAEDRLTPQDAFAIVRNGECAMAIAWPPCAPDSEKAGASGDAPPVSFALLPGARQAYRFGTRSWDTRGEEESPHVPLLATSGRMVAVVSSSSDPRRAQSFVLWLSGRDVSQRVGPHSQATTLFRGSHVATSSRWTGSLPAESSRQYAEVLAETLSLPRSLDGVTLPGRAEYLAALDEAVYAALGGKSAKEALAAASGRWREITDRLGVAAQKRANARSVGRDEP